MGVNWRHTAPGSNNGFLLMSQQATRASCRHQSPVSQVSWVTQSKPRWMPQAVGLYHNEKHLAKLMKSHLCHEGRYWSSPKAVLYQRDPDKQFGQRVTRVLCPLPTHIRHTSVFQGPWPESEFFFFFGIIMHGLSYVKHIWHKVSL